MERDSVEHKNLDQLFTFAQTEEKKNGAGPTLNSANPRLALSKIATNQRPTLSRPIQNSVSSGFQWRTIIGGKERCKTGAVPSIRTGEQTATSIRTEEQCAASTRICRGIYSNIQQSKGTERFAHQERRYVRTTSTRTEKKTATFIQDRGTATSISIEKWTDTSIRKEKRQLPIRIEGQKATSISTE
jgi:hypothetical protein